MKLPRVRYTIRSMLIAIGVIAGLLALPDPWQIIAFALSLLCLTLLYAHWLHSKELLGIAGGCFWVIAIVSNCGYVVLSSWPGLHLDLLIMVWLVLLLPVLA